MTPLGGKSPAALPNNYPHNLRRLYRCPDPCAPRWRGRCLIPNQGRSVQKPPEASNSFSKIQDDSNSNTHMQIGADALPERHYSRTESIDAVRDRFEPQLVSSQSWLSQSLTTSIAKG